ncbi:MAG: pseudouridine synthase [Myxococcales bacterium]|nr:pseudouridine synthase [Myxococcales bacterium]
MAVERLQKILAHAGIASRRAAERLIEEGRVRVNGRRVRELGFKADPHKDRIEVDGTRIVAEKPVYYLLNKPREVITTLDDPEGRPTVGALLKRVPERVYPVGRLDYHTSGVLLMTNDGEMAQALLHPRRRVPKTYIAKVKGHVAIPALDALRKGVDLGEGEHSGPAEVFVANEERGNTWLQITITEGKNRQIHRMLEGVGHRVMRLSRVAFAGLTTEGMPPGAYRPLDGDELRKLKRDYKNPARRKRGGQAEQDMGDELEVADEPRPARKRRPTKKKVVAKRPAAEGAGAASPKAKRPARKKTAQVPKKAAGKAKKRAGSKPSKGRTPARKKSRDQSI